MIYNSGEKPGAGTYICTVCQYEVELKDGEELPVCPVCQATTYEKK